MFTNITSPQKCIVYTRAIPPLIDAKYCISISKPLLFHLSLMLYSNKGLLYFNAVAEFTYEFLKYVYILIFISTLLRKLLRRY